MPAYAGMRPVVMGIARGGGCRRGIVRRGNGAACRMIIERGKALEGSASVLFPALPSLLQQGPQRRETRHRVPQALRMLQARRARKISHNRPHDTHGPPSTLPSKCAYIKAPINRGTSSPLLTGLHHTQASARPTAGNDTRRHHQTPPRHKHRSPVVGTASPPASHAQ